MSPDRREGVGEPEPKLINPFREPGNEGRYKLAQMVADTYRLQRQNPPNSSIDGSQRNVWNSVLNSGFGSPRTGVGVERIQELLDGAVGSPATDTEEDLTVGSHLEFEDEDVRDFLLDLFRHDSSIIAKNSTERINQIFFNLAKSLYKHVTSKNLKGMPPENDRVVGMELFFTHEPLAKAVEFFLIEPDLLPQIPTRKPNEK